MIRSRRAFRSGALALLAALAALPAPREAGAAETAAEVLHSASLYADLVRHALPILERDPDAAALWAILYDARRAVAEIDRLSASASIFEASAHDRQALQELAAQAHLRLALFETHGLEFERARQEIARARAISDVVERPEFRIEWIALARGAPGRAIETRFQRLTLPEFEVGLGSIWSLARAVPFEFSGFRGDELLAVDLERSPRAAPESLEERLLARGAAQLREALEQGVRKLTVLLPPGVYRLRGHRGSDLDRGFVVPEVAEADVVVVDRARFALRVEPRPGPHGPWFFLNGIRVDDLTTMPYGVYRVKADEGHFKLAPETVRFIMGEGMSDKTRTAWTIYVPAAGSTTFEVERVPPGERILRK
ncbi:MAG TPA: hypothetical protein VFT43_04240 [Candidatus Polarisedimenticolia bacterium]|nr:hypothetical protein [Candidatus Polarisedimenticolia bacterium]